MAYEAHEWETGEVITAEKLNNLENGVASAGGGDTVPFVVTFSGPPGGNMVADKTYAEIYEAFNQGKIVQGILRIGTDLETDMLQMRIMQGNIEGYNICVDFANNEWRELMSKVSMTSEGRVTVTYKSFILEAKTN